LGSSSYDVIVVGLGGMGSAAARHLAARGQRVLGLERFTPAHDRGSSHGGTRIVRQAYIEDPAYVPLLLHAYELWEQAGKEADADLLTRTGALYLGPPGSVAVAGSLASAREWGLPHEVLDAAAVRDRFPTLTPQPGDVGVFEERAGYVRPEAAVAVHLELAARDGAELRFDEQVELWSTSGDGVVVSTGSRTYNAGALVLAPGAWAPRLLADLGLPLAVDRQVQYWFDPPGGTAPYEHHPVFLAELDGDLVYGIPAVDGPSGGMKVAFHRRRHPADPDALDRVVTDAEVAEIRAAAARVAPGVPGTLNRATVCMYTLTPDEHFVIGRHPAHERVVIACGFSGHGFKFVPVVGEILADLALEGTTQHPINLFDPRRFG
jgi:sarcosine oxidase